MYKKYLLPALVIVLIIVTNKSFASKLVDQKNRADTSSLFTDHGDYIVLDNGIISAKITKASARITSYKFKGVEVLKDGYYSMDGGKGYSNPNHCQVSVKKQTSNLVDVAFISAWQPGYRQQAFDIECHYVIEKGTSGVYCYAVLTHQASYPATRVGEWRYVWKFPPDRFDHIMIDSLRHMELPSPSDFRQSTKTSIPEAVKLTTGVKAGTYECKYAYSVEYQYVGAYGEVSNKNKIGAWFVMGGYDFFNDGPTHADLTQVDGNTGDGGGLLIHFGRNHYSGSSGIAVDAGEQWSKTFGPYLMYVNSDKSGVDAMWADAKKKVVEEQAKWPYKWITNVPDYPSAAQRGSISGTFTVKDPFKPKLTGGNAWVGVIEPGIDWQTDSKHYQYWIKADAKGNFTIPAIRPGKYTLHAFVNGAIGEFAKNDVVVKEGSKTNIGEVKWDIPRDKGKLVWEIGIPDRTAGEFKFGKQYWNSFMWETYSPALPNPLVYTVGSSDWHNDWNYVQSAYWKKDGGFSQWPWRINFKLDKIAKSGFATLTFAFASTDHCNLQTFVNNENKPFNVFVPTVNTGGNALVRQGIHARYDTYVLPIPVSELHIGDNYITLLGTKGTNRSDHIMYDYLSLEVPSAP